MTCLAVFLTLAGLGCLPLLAFRRIGYGASLLCVASGLAFLSALPEPLMELLPDLPRIFGIVMLCLSCAGVVGAAVLATMGKERLRERLLSPALPVFLSFGVLCAFLSQRPIANGILLLSEKAVIALGGQVFSLALPLCCAACAALADEMPKGISAFLFALASGYAFGCNGLSSYEGSSALCCLWCASALLLLCGREENRTPALLFAPALLFTGGMAGVVAALSLYLLCILLRKQLPEKRPIVLSLFASAMLLPARLAVGGVERLSDRISRFFTSFGGWRIAQNWQSYREEGLSLLPGLLHTLLVWGIILLIPLLISFFFIPAGDRRKSLHTLFFFGGFLLLAPALLVLRLAIPGECYTPGSLAAPLTAGLTADLFVLLHSVRQWDKSAASLGCALLLTAAMAVGCPMQKRFAHLHFTDPASVVITVEPTPSPVSFGSTPMITPVQSVSATPVSNSPTPALFLWMQTEPAPSPTSFPQTEESPAPLSEPENGGGNLNG